MILIDAILLGGGIGKRFSEGKPEKHIPKQFQMLNQAPVFIHALKALVKLDCIRQIAFVVPATFTDLAEAQLREYFPENNSAVRIVVGGSRRQDSSRLGLEALEHGVTPPERVLIHDACRPYLSASLLSRVRDSLFNRSYGAWIPVVPVTETLKKVENGQVMETLDRNSIFRVQTPQAFEFSVIRSLVEKTKELTNLDFTDDASLCEYYGIPVGAFPGDVRNLKLTYEFESQALKGLCSPREAPCEPELAMTYTV